MELAAGTEVGPYIVEGLIGRGGMAVVYEVREPRLGTYHALKVLMVTSRNVRARLRREGWIQADLVHPNVVGVRDTISVDGNPGLLMDLVDGPSLSQVLDAGMLTIDQVDHLARGLIAGVAAAHGHGVIHRDLKPGNILLALGGGEPLAKVSDFGLAKVMNADHEDDDSGDMTARTITGDMMGTPAYMSPEQIKDARRVGPPSDVFSLGAILYELVTGRPAFDGESTLDVLNAIDRGVVVAPRELVPELPERMERAILAALVHDPAGRIQSAEELLIVWNDRVVERRTTSHEVEEEARAVWAKADVQWLASLRPPPDPLPVLAAKDGSELHFEVAGRTAADVDDDLVEEGVLGVRGSVLVAAAVAGVLAVGVAAGAAWVLASGPPPREPAAVSHTVSRQLTSPGSGSIVVEPPTEVAEAAEQVAADAPE